MEITVPVNRWPTANASDFCAGSELKPEVRRSTSTTALNIAMSARCSGVPS